MHGCGILSDTVYETLESHAVLVLRRKLVYVILKWYKPAWLERRDSQCYIIRTTGYSVDLFINRVKLLKYIDFNNF